MKVIVVSICDTMHITETEMINPTVLPSGEVEGYCGSSAHFCDVCGSSGMTVLETKTLA